MLFYLSTTSYDDGSMALISSRECGCCWWRWWWCCCNGSNDDVVEDGGSCDCDCIDSYVLLWLVCGGSGGCGCCCCCCSCMFRILGGALLAEFRLDDVELAGGGVASSFSSLLIIIITIFQKRYKPIIKQNEYSRKGRSYKPKNTFGFLCFFFW